MKKILLFSTLFALCSAFSFAFYQKKSPKTVPTSVVLAEPPPLDEGSSLEWEEYQKHAKENNTTDASFEKLLEQFPKGNLPFSLTANVLRDQYLAMYKPDESKKAERKTLPREFRKFFPALDNQERFSRMPPPIGEPLMAFQTKDNHVLVYFTRRGGYNYYAATFTLKGKLVSEKMMASVYHESLVEGNIGQDLNLTQTKYKMVWEKNSEDSYDYKNMKVKELQFLEKKNESLLKEKGVEKEKGKKEAVIRADP
ncbi:MAG: hypothetical protein JNL70_24835 [Saprospiraceae bacterium]|nr:hypothetical protein [Saprospiraceae bacterium]